MARICPSDPRGGKQPVQRRTQGTSLAWRGLKTRTSKSGASYCSQRHLVGGSVEVEEVEKSSKQNEERVLEMILDLEPDHFTNFSFRRKIV
uniref:Uncharacterized protein n=1 Tax=Knipowitschia caucasica TaxID=637954 RepID=A0AAV2K8L8_KNICA